MIEEIEGLWGKGFFCGFASPIGGQYQFKCWILEESDDLKGLVFQGNAWIYETRSLYHANSDLETRTDFLDHCRCNAGEVFCSDHYVRERKILIKVCRMRAASGFSHAMLGCFVIR